MFVCEIVWFLDDNFYDEMVEQYGCVCCFLFYLLNIVKFLFVFVGVIILNVCDYFSWEFSLWWQFFDDVLMEIISQLWKWLVINKEKYII